MSETKANKRNFAFAGYLAIAGALSMLVGAALWGASGTDLWDTLANNRMESYLKQVPQAKQWLVANTFFWIIGVILMGTAGKLMVGFCDSKPSLAQLASICIQSAVPIAIVSFIIMLSLAIHQPGVHAAFVTGWIGARLDDLATALIVGAFPFIISIAGSPDWIPRWLSIIGVLAGITGLLVIVSLITGIVPLGFIIIPVGLGWMLAAGIMLIRK